MKDGFTEPETLKWVDRPTVPVDAARQIELMKVIPLEKEKKPRSFLVTGLLLLIPVFAAIFYLLYLMLRSLSTSTAILALMAGGAFIGYLVWSFWKASQK